jgi:hypothetical protein
MVFPLRSIQQGDETVETTGGYRCKMVDISEDGCAVMVGGRAKPGLPVKVQTQIGDEDVVLNGTIRGVSQKPNRNVSVLHIQATPPSAPMKNTILTYVYGIFKEENSRSRMGSARTSGG